MKGYRNSCNSGLSYKVMWISLTCLLFIFTLLTTITAKSTVNEIGTKVTSKNATNGICQPLICNLNCTWGYETDPVTCCPICSCWIPEFCAVLCPKGQTCEPQYLQCVTTPCPICIICVDDTSSSTE
ncbi:PREDICTED: uncharacterized protein LOC108769063 [Trachymyrmex cornetzi]|uniref:uncharacterized protein LOC108769063 n=1 Tax=Trachymyrmex cornetzi TaxID=471704 RepID=UPI00084F0095|nr:PREDICTED: uncharacterized protein LOC108769063 [Trachymyrmex cornetzi]